MARGILVSIFMSVTLSLPATANDRVMNGYTIEQFGNFAKEWHLVTVRYRKDTTEMRWTYANDLAWSTLSEGKTNYPEGAIFAKIGLITKEDPAFPVSAVPAGTRRTQFMVRAKKRHAATDGWGYALFDAEGNVLPGDLKQAEVACHACHQIVPERGFVFSQPMHLPNFSAAAKGNWREHVSFVEKSVASLPKKLREKLARDFKSVRVVQGSLSQHMFSGTLDEIRPLLARDVFQNKMPAALVSKNGDLYSVVIPWPKGTCEAGQQRLKGIHTVSDPKRPTYEIEFCQTSER